MREIRRSCITHPLQVGLEKGRQKTISAKENSISIGNKMFLCFGMACDVALTSRTNNPWELGGLESRLITTLIIGININDGWMLMMHVSNYIPQFL